MIFAKSVLGCECVEKKIGWVVIMFKENEER